MSVPVNSVGRRRPVGQRVRWAGHRPPPGESPRSVPRSRRQTCVLRFRIAFRPIDPYGALPGSGGRNRVSSAPGRAAGVNSSKRIALRRTMENRKRHQRRRFAQAAFFRKCRHRMAARLQSGCPMKTNRHSRGPIHRKCRTKSCFLAGNDVSGSAGGAVRPRPLPRTR